MLVLVVAFGLAMVPGDAHAQFWARHAVQVVDNVNFVGVNGLDMVFYINTPEGWDYFPVETVDGGWAEVETWVDEGTASWKIILDSTADDPNPDTYFQWINYPNEEAQTWDINPEEP